MGGVSKKNKKKKRVRCHFNMVRVMTVHRHTTSSLQLLHSFTCDFSLGRPAVR